MKAIKRALKAYLDDLAYGHARDPLLGCLLVLVAGVAFWGALLWLLVRVI